MRRRLTVLGAAVLAVAASDPGVRPAGVRRRRAAHQRPQHRRGQRPDVHHARRQPRARLVHRPDQLLRRTSRRSGANTVRVVLGSGKRWGPSTDVANVIALCKQNRLICVLEVHDTTGYGEDGAAATLDEAVNYWISQKSALVGQENYVVINIGNEPIGNTNAGPVDRRHRPPRSRRCAPTASSTCSWSTRRTGARTGSTSCGTTRQTVLDADTRHNTVLSIHMYGVFNTAASHHRLPRPRSRPTAGRWSSASSAGRFNSSEVDHETILAEAQARGLGYLGWSWAGNNDPILDMTTNFNPSQLTTWGKRIFNGTNGIKATAREATIYSGRRPRPRRTPPVTSPPPSPTASRTPPPPRRRRRQPDLPPAGTDLHRHLHDRRPVAGRLPGRGRVTAGSAAISGWTVTLDLRQRPDRHPGLERDGDQQRARR